ncbi:MAG: peptidase M1 [Lewinellaceae bacterium]|nr:peptidase M1 [Lewinellaceae bacterium]
MFSEILRFEWRYRRGRPATYAYFGILFLFGLITAIYGNSPASEKTFANAPWSIGLMLIIISIFASLIASAVMGVPLYRDIEHQVKDYYFTYPISEKGYLLGRYLGSLMVLLLISLGLPAGLLVGFALGPHLGLSSAEHFGPLILKGYWYHTLAYYWPNLILTGTIFFALVAFTKNVMSTYVASLLLLVGYLAGTTISQDLDNKLLADLLDPFAFNTFLNTTKYWTPVEQNTQVAALTGHLLWNRLIWGGVAISVFAITLWRFDFQRFWAEKLSKREVKTALPLSTDLRRPLPKVQQVFTNAHSWQQLFRLGWLEFTNIVRDRYFLAMICGGVLFLILDSFFGNTIYGTPSLPTTYFMVELKDFDYGLFAFIIIIFFAGEAIHRDRSVKFNGIADALPVPNWVIYGSKFIALSLVAFVLANLVMVSGVLFQTMNGYFDYQFPMYIKDLWFIEFPEYLQLALLTLFVHTMINSKFTGHIVTIGIWLAMFGIRDFAEYDFNMLFYSYVPGYTLSDMNGFGHFWTSLNSFNAYWLSFGAILLIIGFLFWTRGAEDHFRVRRQVARQRFQLLPALGIGLFTILFAGNGAWVYRNTAVLNTYRTSKESKVLRADYEKQYSKYLWIVQPKITDVKVEFDLLPTERKALAKGHFLLVNKSDQQIDSLHLNFGSPEYHREIKRFTLDGKNPVALLEDKRLGYSIYQIPGGMAPGDTMRWEMELDLQFQGFPNSGSGREFVYNGTFSGLGVFPGFGYDPSSELTSDIDRKKYELPEKDYQAPPADDPKGLSRLLFNDDADYITFEATVSTDPDQIAIAPGYLQKEWTQGGRRYFHYVMEGEMDYFFNISSARYAVHRDTWSNPDGTTGNIEIYHHPTHTTNLDRFTNGVKASMEYYSRAFGPYQYRQMRILEFPRYATFAQSFPNTVPYAESFGWVGDFSDPDDTDYAFYVTAHEVAHQWWGHQVTPSATRGANQISESMAEYSALMVLKKTYGVEAMQKFLKYGLDRYLSGRSNESKFEKTLLDNDNQAYVWYSKGSLVLYALQDYVGEDRLNEAFQRFLAATKFRQAPPYATSLEWYRYIQEATPDSLQYFLRDNFEQIALYENRVDDVEVKEIAKGTYEVTLSIDSKKIYYDGNGNILREGKEPNLIEIGLLGPESKNDQGMTRQNPVYLQKHWLKPGRQTLTIIVSEKPLKAGIDPFNKLIDRIPDDNVKGI